MWTWTILSQRCDRTVEFAIVADDDVTGQDGSGDGTDPRTMLGRFANQHNEWVTQSEHLRRWFDDKVLRIFVFARRGTNLIMQPLAGHIGYSLYSGISWF